MWLLRWVPSGLLISGFFIHFAGARWGAYIISPIPGIFLADLVWILGSLFAILLMAQEGWRRTPIMWWGLSATCFLYVIVRAVLGYLNPRAEFVLVVRDLVPFGYLMLAPLAAVALRSISIKGFLWVLRVGALTLLSLDFAVSLGLSTEGIGLLLGGGQLSEMRFPGREDVQGAILGIGLIAWGTFPRIAQAGRFFQFTLLLGGLLLSSRAATIAFLFCLVWAMWRERRPLTIQRLALAVGFVAFGVSIAAFVTSSLNNSAETPNVSVAAPLEPSMGLGSGINRLSTEALNSATGAARIDTYRDVIRYASDQGRWTTGAGLGTFDVLLKACGYDLTAYMADSTLNKCGVDSGREPLPLRDPHNGVLYLVLYHGVVGLVLFSICIVKYLSPPPSEPLRSLSVIPVLSYLVVAMFGVLLSSPFGIMPIVTFTAFRMSRIRAPIDRSDAR